MIGFDPLYRQVEQWGPLIMAPIAKPRRGHLFNDIMAECQPAVRYRLCAGFGRRIILVGNDYNDKSRGIRNIRNGSVNFRAAD